MGIAATQLSAQNATNGTGTTKLTDTYTIPFIIDVWCDGEYVETLYNDNRVVTNHYHFKNGEEEWLNGQWKDLIFTGSSGEIFFTQKGGNEKMDRNGDDWYFESKINLVGSRGTHYKLYLYISSEVFETTARCH
jgi:hypothetical protein